MKLGAIHDHHDSRDHVYSPASALLPNSYTLPFLPPIRDQGKHPSCTGHAAAWAWQQFVASRNQAFKLIRFSAHFLWYYGRAEENHEYVETGTSLRSVMSVLNKRGCPTVETWHENHAYQEEPNREAGIQAAALRLPEYVRCESLDVIRHAIAIEKQAVLLSLPVFPSWTGYETTRTGRVNYSPSKEVELGAHAVAACGYDDQTGYLMVANSWGVSFGDRGFLHIPYELLEWEFWDAWTVNFNAAPNAS